LITRSPAYAVSHATVLVRVVVLGLLLGISATTLAAADAERIALEMKALFDLPGQPLAVEPVSVEGAFAIAGWAQDRNGGRALLQRTGNSWQIVLCGGDALLQPATLIASGLTRDAATRLIANERLAESRMPAPRRALLDRFQGTTKVQPADGKSNHHAAPAAQAAPRPAPAPGPGPGIIVTGAWARAAPQGVAVGAAYFVITNQGRQADTLVSISSPAAATVELHRTTVENGVSRMRPAGQPAIAPGETLKAEPGQLHVMLKGLSHPLVAGTRVPLVLTFRRAGPITVQMDVNPAASISHENYTGH
jgi:copper(I)-binding protein